MRTFTLNNTTLCFDENNGILRGIEYAGRQFITGGGGPLDIALPTENLRYELMRVSPGGIGSAAPDFSLNGRVLTVRYPELGKMFEVPDLPELRGGVEAIVTYTALPDGRSISMQCRVENHCDTPVRQVVFPDFVGLDPVDSKEATRLTTLGLVDHPFIELADTPETRMTFFAQQPSVAGKIYHGGGYFGGADNMIGRYYDYGSLSGGFSVFCKWWGWGPDNMQAMGTGEQLLARLNQETGRLRLGSLHYVTVSKGESYDTAEYILTPHEGGWVNGIGPYKAFVDANKKKTHEMPEHIKKDIGFRTVWVKEQYPADPNSISYVYDDLPAVGQDMLDHGLHELSVWGAHDDRLPYDEDIFYEELGGFDGYRKNVARLREMGINLAPLVSIFSIWRPMMKRYGFDPNAADAAAGWVQNRWAIPSFQAPYLKTAQCFVISQDNKLWQQDVRDALRFLRDKAGVHSIGWDQYLAAPCEGDISDLLGEYIEETKDAHPDMAISGESTFYFEADINHLDYTWDWNYLGKIGDTRAYNYVVRTTRPNVNVDCSPRQAKLCFMDNMFINVYPSKPGGVNGSAMIADYPEFSSTIKRCSELRAEYLDFFLNGDILGDCVLRRDCPTARVTAYRLGDSYLLFGFLNEDGDSRLKLGLAPFTGEGNYCVELHSFEQPEYVSCLTVPGDGTLPLSGDRDTLWYAVITKC